MDSENVIGDWIRHKFLGSGSFGIVSLWRNIKSSDEIAIKMCKWADDVILTAKHKERWTKEVEMMNYINNNNIVGTIVLPEELKIGLKPLNISRLPILSMEYCSKGDLRQVLNQPENSNGLPELDVRCILSDMKNAVNYLHNLKITHRDLKPENIVLQVVKEIPDTDSILRNRTVVYKLIDLGYAKEIDSNSVCASFVGTLQYLAPELLYSKTYSNTVDYWSFGLVAFEIICGIRPFLPNMPPVQWMSHVKRKTSDQICARESLNGEVEFSKELFKENQISNCLKGLLEKWLRIALEWDPKKRGHSEDNLCKSVKFSLPEEVLGEDNQASPSKNGCIEIFSFLETILSKKILILFSVRTYEFLSYEIDESTLFSTVQGWIERDTKVEINKQVFISKNVPGEVDLKGLAHIHWNEKLPVMLYLYPTDCLIYENIKPKLPQRVRYCLENVKLKYPYSHLLAVFSNSLNFVASEKKLYETLIKAYMLRIEYLKIEIRKLYRNHSESEKSMYKLIEKNDLLKRILQIDEKKISELETENNLPQYTTQYKLWSKKVKPLFENIDKLSEAWSQLTVRLHSVARRSNEIHDTETSLKFCSTEFTDTYNITFALVAKIRNTPKENRSVPQSCMDAVKVVYKCLKLRDRLLYNPQTQQLVQKIVDIHVETEKMSSLIVSAGNNAQELSQNLSTLLLEKEELMWSFLTSATSLYADPNTLPCTISRADNTETPSITSFRIGDAMRSPNPLKESNNHTRDVAALETLINDNMSLRLTSENFLKQTYQNNKAMQEELLSSLRF